MDTSFDTFATSEKKAELMFLLQQNISDGLAAGELTSQEAHILLARLEDIRRAYAALREGRVSQDEWQALLGRLKDLEREVNRIRARAHPSSIDEIKIEDRLPEADR
ncbi:MAG: hypothetical protein NT096_02500 [Proteobacteria bacterium]|nr:hypothetical protein [Pseudomonadota bacterium]